jgi:Phosphotransferase enzyme family
MQSPLPLAEARPVPHGATARRLEWVHLPPLVRQRVEQRLGSRVVSADSQGSGFTPGVAARLVTESGERAFLKAANRKAQRQIAEAYAEEARKLGLLPVDRLPVPRLRWTEEVEHWVVLVLEDVAGRNPQRPWDREELVRCLDALATVDAVMSGTDPGFALVPLHQELPTLVTGWDRVADETPDWPHLAEVRDLAHRYAELPDSDHFVHTDARDDNFLLIDDGRTLLCDWNWPALGPRWLDAVTLLASARADGLEVDDILARHPLMAGAPDDAVDAWLAALCGFMVEADLRPVPPSSPYLGVHRRWWSAALWDWLSVRRSW